MQKKHKKKRPSAAKKLSPEHEAQVLALLDELESKDPADLAASVSDPKVAEALIKRLPANEELAMPVLKAFRTAFVERIVQKAVRKAAHRLKTSGITSPDLLPEKKQEQVLKPAKKERPLAYVGTIDGTGTRAVFLAIPQVPRGFELCIGVVNDEKGIEQFLSGVYSKKATMEIQADIFTRAGTMVPTSPSHVATVLENAYMLHREDPKSVPSEYLSIRPRILRKTRVLELPPAYDLMPDADISTEMLTPSRIEKLFGHQLMKSWFLEPEAIRGLAEELAEIEKSPLVLSGAQEGDRVNQLKLQWIEEHFASQKRAVMKQRFEEMAFVFVKENCEEHARISLAAARSMEDEGSRLNVNPVLESLLERSLSFYKSAAEEASGEDGAKETPSSSPLIIT